MVTLFRQRKRWNSSRVELAGRFWNALGYHAKPFCLLDVHGFWRGLDLFMDHVSDSGFLSKARREQLMLAHSPAEAIDMLDAAARNATQGMVW